MEREREELQEFLRWKKQMHEENLRLNWIEWIISLIDGFLNYAYSGYPKKICLDSRPRYLDKECKEDG